MADASAKNLKRKGPNNKFPSKKTKLENGGLSPANKKGPAQNKNSSAQNKNSNQNKKNASPKKVKPFIGTGPIKSKPKQEKNNDKEGKKKRRSMYADLKLAANKAAGKNDSEVLKEIKVRIETISSRGELSKSAKKKLAILKTLQSIVEGTKVAKVNQNPKQKNIKPEAKNKSGAQKGISKGGQKGISKDAQKGIAKSQPEEEEPDNDDDSAEEEESDEEGAADSGEDSVADEDDSDAEEEDDDENDNDEDDEGDDDEESEEEQQPPPKDEQKSQTNNSNVKKSIPHFKGDPEQIDQAKKKNSRFVLFVGNVPYDATKQDLHAHFSKAGEIVHIRIPLGKETKKPRGFCYVEVKDEHAYQQCLSMHHTQLKGRRINVLYTQGGKKNSESKKKNIKVKNMKLHALRKQGKLVGSVKQNQKRSFRRNKSKAVKVEKE
ncbi:nucleolin-like [Cylas formicarius]|uniref:nucleolin-like n=1 Tax=Cylas formicarius TaxID=197179 RepID=UPI0029588F2B|nr:nucleolin-like [Cylas formicarius]